MARKRRGQPIAGLILLDKPRGLSSNQAMQRVRRLLDAQKAGHGGALDPMAEGVLPILLGDATRLSQYALDGDKAYEFGMLFGIETDTGDAEGRETRRCDDPAPSPAQIEAMLPRFTGPLQQVPPMYSALKREGKPLYKLARQGQEIEREPRNITVHTLQLLRVEGGRAWLSATVSKGTYIRTLAMDLAHALGHCAHLFHLRRTAAAGLSSPLVTLETLEEMQDDARRGCVMAADRLLPDWPRWVVDAGDAHALRHGQPINGPHGTSVDEVAGALVLDAEQRVVALVRGKKGQWWPERVFAAEAWQPPCQPGGPSL